MYKNFEEYMKAYIDHYNIKEVKNEKKIIKYKKVFLFFFPLVILVAGLSFLPFSFEKEHNYNSKQINSLYSQKFILEEKYLNQQQINYLNINNKLNKDTFFIDNKKEVIIKIKPKKKFLELASTKIISDSRIQNSHQYSQLSNKPPKWKKDFSKKKIEFIETLLPLIDYQNQQIILERKRLSSIHNFLKANNTLHNSDILYLKKLAKKYYINFENIHKIDFINKLLKSVNTIPNSIVLAQAANESGWGTSRFAKEYNALFGQYTYDKNSGVIPFEREEGKKHLIKYFSSLDKSVESYFININTHHAYEKFRKIRNSMGTHNYEIKLLTGALDVYAEDEHYVNTINLIIDKNNFIQFDNKSYIFSNS